MKDSLKRQRKHVKIAVKGSPIKPKQPTLSELLCTDDMIGHAVKHWLTVCSTRKTICFCVDIAHSLAVAKAFTRKGVSACHIDGSTPERYAVRVSLTCTDVEHNTARTCAVVTLAGSVSEFSTRSHEAAS